MEDSLQTTRKELPAAVFSAVLSGLFLAAGFWPLSLWWPGWVALTPWFVMSPRIDPRRIARYDWIAGAAFYAISLSWLPWVIGWPGAIVLWLGLALLMGVAFRVVRVWADWLGPSALLWAAPICFVGQEYLRSEALPRLRFSDERTLFARGGYLVGPLCAILAAILAAAAAVLERRRATTRYPTTAQGGVRPPDPDRPLHGAIKRSSA